MAKFEWKILTDQSNLVQRTVLKSETKQKTWIEWKKFRLHVSSSSQNLTRNFWKKVWKQTLTCQPFNQSITMRLVIFFSQLKNQSITLLAMGSRSGRVVQSTDFWAVNYWSINFTSDTIEMMDTGWLMSIALCYHSSLELIVLIQIYVEVYAEVFELLTKYSIL